MFKYNSVSQQTLPPSLENGLPFLWGLVATRKVQTATKLLFVLLMLLLPTLSFGGEDVYRCTTKQALELSDKGLMEKPTGIFKYVVGEQFSINRESGEMVGLPFETKNYKKVTVIDKGSTESSYKAFVTSHPHPTWVMYIYVAEQHHGKEKPFWGTDDGDKIFSGYCE